MIEHIWQRFTSVLLRAFAQVSASSTLRNNTKATPRLRRVTLSFNIVTLKYK